MELSEAIRCRDLVRIQHAFVCERSDGTLDVDADDDLDGVAGIDGAAGRK